MNGLVTKWVVGGIITLTMAAGAEGLRTSWVLAAKVDRLQEDVRDSRQDHDSIVELKTRMKHVEEDVGEVKRDTKELLRRIPDPSAR